MKKDWVVAFGTEKFYLTSEDARFYSEQIARGNKFVVLKNGMVLSDKCLYVAPSEKLEEGDLLESGKWQCDSGKWHSKGARCECGKEYVIGSDNVARLQVIKKQIGGGE